MESLELNVLLVMVFFILHSYEGIIWSILHCLWFSKTQNDQLVWVLLTYKYIHGCMYIFSYAYMDIFPQIHICTQIYPFKLFDSHMQVSAWPWEARLECLSLSLCLCLCKFVIHRLSYLYVYVTGPSHAFCIFVPGHPWRNSKFHVSPSN